MAGDRPRQFTGAEVSRNLKRTLGQSRQAVKPQARKPGRESAGRWATLNAFVDVIAPRLTLAERAVWLVLFRRARAGTCDASERGLATQVGITKATAGRALRQLVRLGLVWPVFKSSSKDSASRYGIHPRPDECLAAVVGADERRREAGRQRRQHNGGDRRGRRRGESREPGESFTRLVVRTG